MEEQIKFNAVNQAIKGNVILQEDSDIDCICMILKGRVAADGRGTYTILSPGFFLGINDLFVGRALCNYIAVDDVMFYAFPIKDIVGIKQILKVNKDYNGLMLFSMSRYIVELCKTRDDLLNSAQELYTFVKEIYDKYKYFGVSEGMKTQELTFVTELKKYSSEQDIDEKMLSYYEDDARVTLDKHKEYYTDGTNMVLFHMKVQSELINGLLIACKEAADYLEDTLYLLMNRGEHNLYICMAAIIIALEKKKIKADDMIAVLDQIVEKINRIETLFHDRIGRELQIDRNKIEKTYYSVMMQGELLPEEKKSEENKALLNSEVLAQTVRTLKGSLQQILEYSEWDSERSNNFKNLMNEFILLGDRLSVDDDVRKLRKRISEQFYNLYETVFLKEYHKHKATMAVQLFLNYAYLDERLLTDEQIMDLCSIEDEEKTIPCMVYSVREWLTLIYECKKDPSKSEFDMDFAETLRDRKKDGSLDDAGVKKAFSDPLQRLEFEIHNMFSYNGRLVNGQVSTYVPFLFDEGFSWKIKTCHNKKANINKAIEKILLIDPSIFYRESLYMNKEAGVEKDYICRQIFPDIILLPTNGTNGVMWQEITGKRRDTAGRFIFPIFFEANIEDILVKTFARFRWEICRTIQGTDWNNVQVKSLTSEYSDYLQFYKKNRDLSEERKEKLKLQIQKGRGNNRETFVIDYELWVKSEAYGAIRMNKVAREIIATYCPFSKAQRKSLSLQPIFAEATARFERNLSKKIYELESRFRAYERDRIEIPEALIATLNYYKNM